MITYQVETWETYYRDCTELWKEDCTELGDGRQLNPEIETYEALEKLGMLLIITARSDQQLIGYKIFMVRPNLHHRDILSAFEDCSFVSKNFRFGKVSLRLMQFAQEILETLKVEEMFCLVNSAGGTGRLMEKYKFKLNSLVYSKRI